MKVVVYEPWYNEKHCEILRAFARGIPNAVVKDVRNYEPCDVAVIFGLVKDSYENTWAKKKILENHSGHSLIVVESAFVCRGQYWAIGWGGIHGDADFKNQTIKKRDRWNNLKVDIQPWTERQHGVVLVCGQVPWDTNVQDVDHPKWCRETVEYFAARGYPVVFRPHPRIEDPSIYGVRKCFWDVNKKIRTTLKKSICAVTWNSTSGVDALIAGVPVIAMSPNSMVRSVSSHSFDLADLVKPDRKDFLAKLAYSQWTKEEMRSGVVWRHLNR